MSNCQLLIQAFYGTQRSEVAAKKRKERIDEAKRMEHRARVIDLCGEMELEEEELGSLRRDSSYTPLILLKRGSR